MNEIVKAALTVAGVPYLDVDFSRVVLLEMTVNGRMV
jgi:hypothetical protein